MHIQGSFAETDRAVLYQLIQDYPLGALVMQGDAGLEVNHMPFILVEYQGNTILQAHIPIANAIHTLPEQEAVVLFQGPQTYISPEWYPTKRQHGKAVPTWNYAVVHAYGRPVFIHDRDWLLQHVTKLTERHESGRTLPWKVTDAPENYLDTMLKRIVGVELVITRLAGKCKLSQNRPLEDRHGVVAGLREQGTQVADAMAALVNDRI